MTLDELYKKYGSANKMAKALGICRTLPIYWKKIGYIPLHAQVRIEFITNGELKANLD